jgi:hypothetical protein
VTTDDIVERIRKLLRLAENAGATEAEAAAALERANALLVRHNLSMDAIAVSGGEQPTVTEQHIRAGWAGSWRGSLLGILARHNLCSPIISRRGRTDTVVVVGRPANVQATHAMYEWIAEQLEHFAQQEWLDFNASQHTAIATHPDVPWCVQCEDWTETYEGAYRSGRWELNCIECDERMLSERPLVHGFTWKTAFYRGAILRISNRLYEQRHARQDDGPVTALVLRTDHENAAYIDQRFGDVRKGRPRRAEYHSGAYERGKQRGGDVSLAPRSRLKGGDATV